MKNADIITFDNHAFKSGEWHLKLNSSKDYFERRIALLEGEIHKPKIDFSLLKEMCLELIIRFPLPVHYYKDSWLIRCRPNYNGEVFSDVGQLSYNPDPKATVANRFNIKEDQVFYCAAPIDYENGNGCLTSICEVQKELFDRNFPFQYQYYTLSKWNVRKEIPLVLLTFCDDNNQHNLQSLNINPVYSRNLSRVCVREDFEKCKLIYNYFSELACKSVDRHNSYLLTTAFYHAIKDYYGAETGILYPSSMTEKFGLNIVLSKEIVDADYLQFNEVIMYKVQRSPNNPFHYNSFPCSKLAKPDVQGKFCISGIC